MWKDEVIQAGLTEVMAYINFNPLITFRLMQLNDVDVPLKKTEDSIIYVYIASQFVVALNCKHTLGLYICNIVLPIL